MQPNRLNQYLTSNAFNDVQVECSTNAHGEQFNVAATAIKLLEPVALNIS